MPKMFTGRGDPIALIIWFSDLDDYFILTQFDRSKGRDLLFAGLLLQGGPKSWWNSRRCHILTWDQFTTELMHEYIPPKAQLLDEWNHLHQGRRELSAFVRDLRRYQLLLPKINDFAAEIKLWDGMNPTVRAQAQLAIPDNATFTQIVRMAVEFDYLLRLRKTQALSKRQEASRESHRFSEPGQASGSGVQRRIRSGSNRAYRLQQEG
ncbi:hypothetical protein NEOLI_003972 [Neolecta irregularis DAH-3]|uniref:Retrotransposon gag domain-containing protein n=1 Tax=Neolecta irregularis (strain DAH-3) TaxID=1198029 RepID=A0A1U7LJW2_NEOID|nr:hypothetical protein NEOLI_003972 [Neolecta irregularis DAH-3]|eukprot:OLL22945.1 hypothetical protein NEOLI_003972 [Neolecta irregularis DAH-3]